MTVPFVADTFSCPCVADRLIGMFASSAGGFRKPPEFCMQWTHIVPRKARPTCHLCQRRARWRCDFCLNAKLDQAEAEYQPGMCACDLHRQHAELVKSF